MRLQDEHFTPLATIACAVVKNEWDDTKPTVQSSNLRHIVIRHHPRHIERLLYKVCDGCMISGGIVVHVEVLGLGEVRWVKVRKGPRGSRERHHLRAKARQGVKVRDVYAVTIGSKPSYAGSELRTIESCVDLPLAPLVESADRPAAGDNARTIASVQVKRGESKPQNRLATAALIDRSLTPPFRNVQLDGPDALDEGVRLRERGPPKRIDSIVGIVDDDAIDALLKQEGQRCTGTAGIWLDIGAA